MSETQPFPLAAAEELHKTTLFRRKVKTYPGKRKPDWAKLEEAKQDLLESGDEDLDIDKNTVISKVEEPISEIIPWKDNGRLRTQTGELRKEFIREHAIVRKNKAWWDDEEFAETCKSYGLFSCPYCGEFYDSFMRHQSESPHCTMDTPKEEPFVVPEPKRPKKIRDTPAVDPADKVKLIMPGQCLCGTPIPANQDCCSRCHKYKHTMWTDKVCAEPRTKRERWKKIILEVKELEYTRPMAICDVVKV
jgi:hypothetical protein